MDARAARIQRGDVAQRWVSILVGLATIFVVGWMTYEATQPHAAIKKDADGAAAAHSAGASSSSSSSPVNVVMGDAGADEDAGLFMPTSLSFGDASLGASSGGGMPSGAPRQVKIGVVLVHFQGAEGAPSSARRKADALVVAERLGQEAKTDFHQAVKGGDSGSSDDIGRLPRGVLDPRTEVAVFALAPGDVSDVLETPKGYWIVKRIE